MRLLPRILTATAVAVALTACGGGDADTTAGGDDATAPATEDETSDESDETSMPADDDVQPTGEVTQGEAEAVGTAYLGLTVEEAQAQAEVDGRQFRVGEEDGEAYMLTEDYVLGRVTATVTDGTITQVVVEATDGPVTVTQ